MHLNCRIQISVTDLLGNRHTIMALEGENLAEILAHHGDELGGTGQSLYTSTSNCNPRLPFFTCDKLNGLSAAGYTQVSMHCGLLLIIAGSTQAYHVALSHAPRPLADATYFFMM